MRSDTISWSVAILLSLFMHSLMFMQYGARLGAETDPVLQVSHITRLSFSESVAKLALDNPPPVKKQKTMPIPAASVKKVKSEPTRSLQLNQEKTVVEAIESTSQQAALPQAYGKQVSQSTDGLLNQKRERYLHKLLSYIESFKFYPRSARRRLIEGDVKISFMLRDDGYFEQLVLDGKQATLVKATQQAMQSASPLPVPPEDIDLPRHIEFTMAYTLVN